MHILIQSFLRMAEQLNSSIHIRYSAKRKRPMGNGGNQSNGKEADTTMKRVANEKKPSMVIIRQPYTYLEPYVRPLFEGAEDVQIIMDRRLYERRQVPTPWIQDRRNSSIDRRVSAPMLDIQINLDA